MAKLIIWRDDGGIQPLLDVETRVEGVEVSWVSEISEKWPAITFIYPDSVNRQYGHLALSWDEVDELIRQLTAIKTTKKPTIKEFIAELEEIENRLDRMPSEISGFARSGTLHERRLNLLSEIVKRLVR